MAPSYSLWLYRLLVHGAVPVAMPALWLSDRASSKSRPPFSHRLSVPLPVDMPTGGLWLQAVSVGEVELARRLVRELSELAPEVPLLITATTATGLALAKRSLAGSATIAPCPLDLPAPTRSIFRRARPRVLGLVETELWPEMLHQAGRHQVPAVVINARLSPGSFARYHRVRFFLRSLLAPIRLVLARSEADAERFTALGIPADRVEVGGNLKFDLEPNPEPLIWAERIKTIAGSRPIVVAGSTMEGEEDLVLDAFDRLRGLGHEPFLILAPRHPERFDRVAELLAERGLATLRRSTLEQGPDEAEVFLIDIIGELSRAYALAKAAFIGGSLVGTGGHNPLEAAVWAVPSLTGPHVHNFAEVYEAMVTAGATVVVDDSASLADTLHLWLSDSSTATTAGIAGRKVVLDNRGATARAARALLAVAGLDTATE